MAAPKPQWDAVLQQLMLKQTITGYCLISHAGACLASFGQLDEELWRSPASVQKFLALFHTAATPDHLEVCGQQAIIVNRTDSSVYAVSRGKQLGVTAHYLPSGVLVTVSAKPSLLQTVVPQVEAACDVLRQP